MSKVVVTGAGGNCGRVIRQHLHDSGHGVVAVDLISMPGVITADLSDFGDAIGAIEGADAVVHFGAIPSDRRGTPAQIFRNNMLSTLNVLQAAKQVGVRSIVMASSIQVHGPYAEADYVPVDEKHRPCPKAPYGISKWLGEKAADVYADTARVSIASLRLLRIMYPHTYAECLPPFFDNPALAADCLWGYIDGRDVAEICRLAIETDLAGHEVFYVAAADTHMNIPTRDLLEKYRPDIKSIRGPLDGTSGLFSLGKLKQRLGFTPKHEWRDYFRP